MSVWRVLWPQHLPQGLHLLQASISYTPPLGFLLLLSILPSDTCLRFRFLNTVDEVHKLPANEVKLPGQEIEFFRF